MAHRKLPEATVERLVTCQRGGVCDDGTADSCGVDLKTVHRFQRVAALRAHAQQQHVVQRVDVEGVQRDERHAKVRRQRVEWVVPALAMGSLFLLWVEGGPRPQDSATRLMAQGIARVSTVPLFFTDGWKASTGALLHGLGRLSRPRRRGTVGRKPKARLVAPSPLLSARLVTLRTPAGHVVTGPRRVVLGGPRRFFKHLRLHNLGETMQTACMERWSGTLRGLVAPRRRRTRCLSWCRTRHQGRVWLVVSLSNFVMPHKSLRQGRTRRTPAMAIGLTDHVWSDREYLWLPVHPDKSLKKQRDERLQHLLTPALEDTRSTSTRRAA